MKHLIIYNSRYLNNKIAVELMSKLTTEDIKFVDLNGNAPVTQVEYLSNNFADATYDYVFCLIEPSNVSPTVRSSTARAGGSPSTIVLDAGSSATNDAYNGTVIAITQASTGLVFCNPIIDYNGVTKIATLGGVLLPFSPAATETFVIYNAGTPSYDTFAQAWRALKIANSTSVRADTCQAGGSTSTVVLDAAASGTDDTYNDMIIAITETATGKVYYKRIYDYAGGTVTATLGGTVLPFSPGATDTFVIYSPSTTYMPVAAATPSAKSLSQTGWEAAFPNININDLLKSLTYNNAIVENMIF